LEELAWLLREEQADSDQVVLDRELEVLREENAELEELSRAAAAAVAEET